MLELLELLEMLASYINQKKKPGLFAELTAPGMGRPYRSGVLVVCKLYVLVTVVTLIFTPDSGAYLLQGISPEGTVSYLRYSI